MLLVLESYSYYAERKLASLEFFQLLIDTISARCPNYALLRGDAGLSALHMSPIQL